MAFNEIVDENHHIDHSNTPFGERFPSLVLLGDLPIDAWRAMPGGLERFAVRARNGLGGGGALAFVAATAPLNLTPATLQSSSPPRALVCL